MSKASTFSEQFVILDNTRVRVLLGPRKTNVSKQINIELYNILFTIEKKKNTGL